MSDMKNLKPYKTPTLKMYGNVEQITQGNVGGNMKDNGKPGSSNKTGG